MPYSRISPQERLVKALATGVIVDDTDLDLLSKYSWYKDNKGYIRGSNTQHGVTQHVKLHRLIALRMGLEIDGYQIDHVDRNKSNNSRSNLRRANNSQNMANSALYSNSSTGYKGVRWTGTRWAAVVGGSSNRQYLGCFDTAEDAARAYDEAAIARYGTFATTNASLGRYKDETATA